MPAAYVKEFTFNGKVITSVVMDEAEFLAFCDELDGIFNKARRRSSSPGTASKAILPPFSSVARE